MTKNIECYKRHKEAFEKVIHDTEWWMMRQLNIMIEWNDDDRDGECERRTQNEGEWCSNFF